ncbi:Metal dependent phosphohydrolase [Croceitalea dokdonensis DOKDO 023]|uniref:Metal dependent phosphohydrolase n=1 Tax=Croceitalea dokdonensis DOKDO 023 TaxID=1300341 RepID=A0A0P7AYS6_9FLAO|nr:HD domain-containing protein [Croceitalea dokdonensis]KPM33333.1 Metal dependent phosphohydrolase [Croceitalea dokdonensis DOKDO 023]
MSEGNKLKIFNDPIYGFIGTPNELIFNLIAHKYFQRLRRVSQMGLSFLVYPGAHHTRFHHALGSMHLMVQAIRVLKLKGVQITDREEKGLLAAILLHDIGHGPFSHALEYTLLPAISHETVSLGIMEDLNAQFHGELAEAITIFKGEHPKKFLNQLVSSQLDMDRLDYLKRDSFYTGVTEGNISSERMISMLHISNGNLVVEEKGIYSVEKFLMARRFMYWQVYLHKTSLVAEKLLVKIIQRAKYLQRKGKQVPCSAPLAYFLKKQAPVVLNAEELEFFTALDDVDMLSALKIWQHHEDGILARLSAMLLNRNLLHIKLKNKPIDVEKLRQKEDWVHKNYGLDREDLHYFVFSGEVSNRAYDNGQQNINIYKKNGKVIDVANASDHLNLKALSKKVTKYYLCYPKESV